ncbi:MAG: hypothetical protein JWR22_3358 [Herminiimonas sp.]|nr:hypothetical protein [Herminiimonas sp.]
MWRCEGEAARLPLANPFTNDQKENRHVIHRHPQPRTGYNA